VSDSTPEQVEGTDEYTDAQIERMLNVFNEVGAAFANLQFAARQQAERVDAAMEDWYKSLDEKTRARVRDIVLEREAKQQEAASNGEG
jgi:hypothetical protein